MQRKEKNSIEELGGFPLGFHIEADRVFDGVALSVSAVSSVIDFSENRAELRSGRSRIAVYGKELTIAVYENGTVEIIGKISGVSFL